MAPSWKESLRVATKDLGLGLNSKISVKPNVFSKKSRGTSWLFPRLDEAVRSFEAKDFDPQRFLANSFGDLDERELEAAGKELGLLNDYCRQEVQTVFHAHYKEFLEARPDVMEVEAAVDELRGHVVACGDLVEELRAEAGQRSCQNRSLSALVESYEQAHPADVSAFAEGGGHDDLEDLCATQAQLEALQRELLIDIQAAIQDGNYSASLALLQAGRDLLDLAALAAVAAADGDAQPKGRKEMDKDKEPAATAAGAVAQTSAQLLSSWRLQLDRRLALCKWLLMDRLHAVLGSPGAGGAEIRMAAKVLEALAGLSHASEELLACHSRHLRGSQRALVKQHAVAGFENSDLAELCGGLIQKTCITIANAADDVAAVAATSSLTAAAITISAAAAVPANEGTDSVRRTSLSKKSMSDNASRTADAVSAILSNWSAAPLKDGGGGGGSLSPEAAAAAAAYQWACREIANCAHMIGQKLVVQTQSYAESSPGPAGRNLAFALLPTYNGGSSTAAADLSGGVGRSRNALAPGDGSDGGGVNTYSSWCCETAMLNLPVAPSAAFLQMQLSVVGLALPFLAALGLSHGLDLAPVFCSVLWPSLEVVTRRHVSRIADETAAMASQALGTFLTSALQTAEYVGSEAARLSRTSLPGGAPLPNSSDDRSEAPKLARSASDRAEPEGRRIRRASAADEVCDDFLRALETSATALTSCLSASLVSGVGVVSEGLTRLPPSGSSQAIVVLVILSARKILGAACASLAAVLRRHTEDLASQCHRLTDENGPKAPVVAPPPATAAGGPRGSRPKPGTASAPASAPASFTAHAQYSSSFTLGDPQAGGYNNNKSIRPAAATGTTEPQHARGFLTEVQLLAPMQVLNCRTRALLACAAAVLRGLDTAIGECARVSLTPVVLQGKDLEGDEIKQVKTSSALSQKDGLLWKKPSSVGQSLSGADVSDGTSPSDRVDDAVDQAGLVLTFEFESGTTVKGRLEWSARGGPAEAVRAATKEAHNLLERMNAVLSSLYRSIDSASTSSTLTLMSLDPRRPLPDATSMVLSQTNPLDHLESRAKAERASLVDEDRGKVPGGGRTLDAQASKETRRPPPAVSPFAAVAGQGRKAVNSDEHEDDDDEDAITTVAAGGSERKGGGARGRPKVRPAQEKGTQRGNFAERRISRLGKLNASGEGRQHDEDEVRLPVPRSMSSSTAAGRSSVGRTAAGSGASYREVVAGSTGSGLRLGSHSPPERESGKSTGGRHDDTGDPRRASRSNIGMRDRGDDSLLGHDASNRDEENSRNTTARESDSGSGISSLAPRNGSQTSRAGKAKGPAPAPAPLTLPGSTLSGPRVRGGAGPRRGGGARPASFTELEEVSAEPSPRPGRGGSEKKEGLSYKDAVLSGALASPRDSNSPWTLNSSSPRVPEPLTPTRGKRNPPTGLTNLSARHHDTSAGAGTGASSQVGGRKEPNIKSSAGVAGTSPLGVAPPGGGSAASTLPASETSKGQDAGGRHGASRREIVERQAKLVVQLSQDSDGFLAESEKRAEERKRRREANAERRKALLRDSVDG